MSARSFRSLFMVASCAGAALSCYLVSLRVASERAALEDVETQIVLAQRDIRLLQTEIGTRGRLAQLERWNASVLALSAPGHDQFLQGGFELARLARPDQTVDFDAPVVLAAAPAPEKPAVGDAARVRNDAAVADPSKLIHQASLNSETREVPAKVAASMPPAATLKSNDRPATAAKPAKKGSLDKTGLAAAQSSTVKTPAKPKAAKADKAEATVKPKAAKADKVEAPVKPVRTAKAEAPKTAPALKSSSRESAKAQ